MLLCSCSVPQLQSPSTSSMPVSCWSYLPNFSLSLGKGRSCRLLFVDGQRSPDNHWETVRIRRTSCATGQSPCDTEVESLILAAFFSTDCESVRGCSAIIGIMMLLMVVAMSRRKVEMARIKRTERLQSPRSEAWNRTSGEENFHRKQKAAQVLTLCRLEAFRMQILI